MKIKLLRHMDGKRKGDEMKKLFHQISILWAFFLCFGISPVSLDAATPEKINASYGAISGSMSPIWVAKEARLFEKQGLDLNLV